MALADRDYMRPKPSGGGDRAWTTALTVAAVALAIAAIPSTRHWVQRHVGNKRPLVATVQPLGVGPGVQLGSPYPANDAWAKFLPSRSACPAATSAPASKDAAETSMVCALNYARVREGLTALPVSPLLQRSSRLKALDIIRCQQFAHEACGKDPRAVADAVGYPQVSWGENIYAGSGPFAPPRVAADGWLNSPHHRENLFRPEWTEQGVAVVVAKRFRGQRNVAIWVSEFGERR
jgi:uncharacterized protein YkwD